MFETTLQANVAATVEEIRRRLDALLALVEQEPPEQLETRALAARLGLTPTALSAFARARGPGASRDGWRVVGRATTGRRSTYLWEKV